MDQKSGQDPKAPASAIKLPLHLIPPSAAAWLAMALKSGADKYGAYNWRALDGRRLNVTTYIAAAQRHLAALLDGEDNDPESGLPHAAHVMAGMAILLDARAAGTLEDDRPPAGMFTDLAKLLTEPAK